MQRITRLAVLVGIFGLLTTTIQPARALTGMEIEFVAQITVAGGMGYPSVTLPVSIPSGVSCVPLSTDFLIPTNCHVVHEHQQPLSGNHLICIDEGVHLLKPSQNPAFAGACEFTMGGTIKGHCGLNGGQVVVGLVDAKGHFYTLDVHYNKVAQNLIFTGHWRNASNGQHGLVLGEAVVTPVPPVFNECGTKGQEEFLWTGAATLVPTPL